MISDPDHPDQPRPHTRLVGLEEQELMARLERYAAPLRAIGRVAIGLSIVGLLWFLTRLALEALR